MRLLLVLLSLLCSSVSLACDCKDFTQQFEAENSDFIFIGKIINSTEALYSVKILESFKGFSYSSDSILIIKKNSCSVEANEDEIWLMYANLINEELTISRCGYSENLNLLGKKNSSKILPPKPLDYSDEEMEIINSLYELKTINQVHFYITSLRIKKMEKNIELLEHQLSSNSNLKPESDRNNYSIYLIILIILNIAIIFLVFKRR